MLLLATVLLLLLTLPLVAWLLLLDGTLVIAPPRTRALAGRKVFVVGLSRTGTTSIAVALHQLGFRA